MESGEFFDLAKLLPKNLNKSANGGARLFWQRGFYNFFYGNLINTAQASSANQHWRVDNRFQHDAYVNHNNFQTMHHNFYSQGLF
jgi:hypothetical protein